MRVVGTAGHVDHGKSTLVKRLTGIDPDRLAEEKAREMTIDLGFAWLTLPNGETLGLVDVPGHRDFIENMLAGVGGIDAALLVIAADEGVMPQTREHLAILDLLGISHGLIVLTKTDLVDDPDWLLLVEADIRALTEGTHFAQADIVRVSARTGAGMPVLVERLTDLLAAMPPRAAYGQPRLPIDRVFSISGFGTVVTGTLLGGALRVGDEVEVQPGGLRGRVRGLQSYKQNVETAEPGSRVAVNIAGVERTAVQRGHILAYPGALRETMLVDVRFRHLEDARRPLKHDAEVKFFSGAAETVAHVRLLDAETLPPGMEGWLQIRLEEPLALAAGDRFILRYPSPSETIGGGIIVNPHPARKWKRFQADVLHDLQTRLEGTPAERLVKAAGEPVKPVTLQKQLGYSQADFDAALHEAVESGLVVVLPDGMLLAQTNYDAITRRMLAELRLFHEAEPLRLGMSREALRSRLGLKAAFFNTLLDTLNESIIAERDLLRLSDHQIRFTDEQQIRVNALLAQMNAAPYTPPSWSEAAGQVGEAVLYALADLGEIVPVAADVMFTRVAYNEMVQAALTMIDAESNVTAAGLRDRFGTSRKYAISLLEHLDSVGVTRRVGDARVRGKAAPTRRDSVS
jgi:selenocysteine-specific elongation factor